MLKIIKTIVIVLLVAFVVTMVLWPKEAAKQPVKEVPCEELNWMRDLPQARCQEYWDERNKLEEV